MTNTHSNPTSRPNRLLQFAAAGALSLFALGAFGGVARADDDGSSYDSSSYDTGSYDTSASDSYATYQDATALEWDLWNQSVEANTAGDSYTAYELNAESIDASQVANDAWNNSWDTSTSTGGYDASSSVSADTSSYSGGGYDAGSYDSGSAVSSDSSE